MKGYSIGRGIIFCLMSFILFMIQSSTPVSSISWFQPDPREKDWVDQTLSRMTLAEKVGQMFIVGFQNGNQPALEANDQIKRLIREEHAGGVILFDRNLEGPRQVTGLTRDLQQLALSSSPGIPLFISVDQEGGKVVRLREGVTVFPGNMALGATNDLSLSQVAGHITGKELRALGINMNMAPSLDVNNNAKNPIIGVRSFGQDPQKTAEMAIAHLQGYQEGKVLTVVKHFPGHGDTTLDSHIDVPTVPHEMTRLEQVELVPFKKAIAKGVDAVMSAHITFPAIDDRKGLPGTLSPKVLTGLLRERLGYDGVIMTDDMEMGAIVENFGSDDATLQAVKAGADIILVAHDWTRQKKSIEALKQAVQKGEISEKRIDQSVRRILKLKAERLGEQAIIRQPIPDLKRGVQEAGSPQNRKQAQKVADHAVTLVRDNAQQLPLNPEVSRRVLTISPVNAKVMGDALKKRGFQPITRSIEAKPEASVIASLTQEAADVDAVVIGTSQAQLHEEQAQLVNSLEATGTPVIVLGLDTPYDLTAIPGANIYLALYSSNTVALEAGVEAITGRIPIRGKLPVEIPGMYPLGHGVDVPVQNP